MFSSCRVFYNASFTYGQESHPAGPGGRRATREELAKSQKHLAAPQEMASAVTARARPPGFTPRPTRSGVMIPRDSVGIDDLPCPPP